MYEQGPIRPPSEASSLLVRVTRNCPWNRCLFRPAYKVVAFSRRMVEEVTRDIDAMAKDYGHYKEQITSAFLQDANSLNLNSPLLAARDGFKIKLYSALSAKQSEADVITCSLLQGEFIQQLMTYQLPQPQTDERI